MTWDRDEELEEETVKRAEAIAAGFAPTSEAVPAPQSWNANGGTAFQTAPTLQQQYQIVTEAQRRLAKAQLYQALLDQSVFGQSSVDPVIVEEVSSELRNFALERLEIMLGMRAATNVSPNDALTLTPQEVAQVRELLAHTLEGNVPVLGVEESTALRLLLAKITGKAPSLPKKLTPMVQPVQIRSTTPVNTVMSPAIPPPVSVPTVPPRTRRRSTTNPNKKPMPTVDMMNQKIATEAAASSTGNSATPSVLGIAIQTALTQANKETK